MTAAPAGDVARLRLAVALGASLAAHGAVALAAALALAAQTPLPPRASTPRAQGAPLRVALVHQGASLGPPAGGVASVPAAPARSAAPPMRAQVPPSLAPPPPAATEALALVAGGAALPPAGGDDAAAATPGGAAPRGDAPASPAEASAGAGATSQAAVAGGGGGGPAVGAAAVEEALSARLADAAARCYPLAARRYRLEGTAVVRFCLDAQGALASAEVRTPSGAALLDGAATACVVPGALPFPPGAGGCYRVPVHFVVP